MSKPKFSKYDVVVVGAGPAGLSFARALADTGLSICVVEKQSAATLEAPPLDGRDIALTHDTLALLSEMGMLHHIPKSERSPIREARVFSGPSSYFLGFSSKNTGKDALGVLVPNNHIRRAAYLAVKIFSNVTLKNNAEVIKISTDDIQGTVYLSTGEILKAPLVVAADTRFSSLRQAMHIEAATNDFHRTAIVCRMTHTKSHERIAQECFFDSWTLAILPLHGDKSSIVLTLPSGEAKEVMALSNAAFSARITDKLRDRLGTMRLVGKRYAYPLVAVYAHKFSAQRFALIGDAAVGMHPVTAHGYNLGLSGAVMLVAEIKKALSLGLDIGSEAVTLNYARLHRQETAFLYYGTNAMVALYTDQRKVAMTLRAAGLRLANHLPIFKRYVTRQLTGKHAA